MCSRIVCALALIAGISCWCLMGHFGREKTLLMLADHFYWPKMRRDVDRLVKRCITCNKSKSKLKPHGLRSEEHRLNSSHITRSRMPSSA